MKIWEPKPPGTFRATPGLLRDCFTSTIWEKSFRVFVDFYCWRNIFVCSSLPPPSIVCPVIWPFSTIHTPSCPRSTIKEDNFLSASATISLSRTPFHAVCYIHPYISALPEHNRFSVLFMLETKIRSRYSNAVALCPDGAWLEFVELGYLNKTLTIHDLKISSKWARFKGFQLEIPRNLICLHDSSYIVRRNCPIKHVIEGNTKGRIDEMERRGKRRKQLPDYLKEKTRDWKLKEKVFARVICAPAYFAHRNF